MVQFDGNDPLHRLSPSQPWSLRSRSPRPCIPKPYGGKEVKLGAFRPAIYCLDSDQDIVRGGLRVFHQNVEVTIVVENAGIDELELDIAFTSPSIFVHEFPVGKLTVRVLVEIFHVRVSRR